MFQGLRLDLVLLWVGYAGRTLGYLGIVLVLSRVLGADGYGELALFLGVTLGVSQLSGSWPFMSLPVLHPKGASLAAVFRPAALVAAVCTAGALVIAVPAALLIDSGSAMSVWAVIVYSVALVGLQASYSVFQAAGKMGGIALTQSLERGVTLVVLIIVGVTVSFSIRGAETLMAVSSLVVFILVTAYVGRRFDLWKKPAPTEKQWTWHDVLEAVGPLGIVTACAYGVAWMDIFVLSFFQPSDEVGTYTLAYQIFTFVLQIGSLWAVATLPRHSRMSADGHHIKDQLPVRAMTFGTTAWAGLMAVGVAVAAILVGPVFGDDFLAAVAPLAVLMAGAGVSATYFVITPALIGDGRARFMAVISIAGVLVNLALDLILVPTIGPVGAAIGTGVQTVLVTAIVLLESVGRGATLKVLGAGLPASLAILAVAVQPDSHLVAGVVGAAGLISIGIGMTYLTKGRPGGQDRKAVA